MRRIKLYVSILLCFVMLLSLTPSKVMAEGGDQGGGPYTITLNLGENGSVTSVTQKIGEEDATEVNPDEPDGNTYTVPAGSDVTFTFEPDEDYIIGELWADGRPEIADENNKFTIRNVGGSQQVEVTFIKVQQYTITVQHDEHVTIAVEKNGEAVIPVNNQFPSQTRDIVRYYFELEPGYKLKGVEFLDENGVPGGVFTDYDHVAGMIYAEMETEFNYTLIVETEALTGLPTPYYAILTDESGSDAAMKKAIRRELALQGIIVSDSDITFGNGTDPANSNDVEYKEVYVRVPESADRLLGVAHFYIVDNAKTLLIMNEPTGGDKELTVYDGSGLNDFDPVTITIPPITSGKIYAFGPYAAFAMDMSRAIGLNLPVVADDDGSYIVNGPFYNMQWHVVNQGNRDDDTEINWYPTNVVTSDAIYIEAKATKNGATQEAGAWSIDTSPRVNSVDGNGAVNYRLEVFFGNDVVTISPPAGGGRVTGVAVREESDSPGYTFEIDPDNADAVKVTFHSDFYDLISVPLTLSLNDNTAKSANVTIHRVGVDIQEHNRPGPGYVVHGTQNGSLINIEAGKYMLTASYYIPYYGGIEHGNINTPYGLFITRKYPDGRVETQTVCVPIGDQSFDYGSNTAPVVDYVIYYGSGSAAPVSVSVLVLKEEPTGNGFGGVSFGSGIGVTWEK